jgi:ADP-glucose pyrophosphorylase
LKNIIIKNKTVIENVIINQTSDVKDNHQIITTQTTLPKKEKGLLKSLAQILAASLRLFL